MVAGDLAHRQVGNQIHPTTIDTNMTVNRQRFRRREQHHRASIGLGLVVGEDTDKVVNEPPFAQFKGDGITIGEGLLNHLHPLPFGGLLGAAELEPFPNVVGAFLR